ncbi:MAG: hypothetical protein P8181_17025 [bacterium]
MLSWERLPWIGLGIVLASIVSFVIGVKQVRRGRRNRSYLAGETVQDVGFVCLGVSLMFGQGTTARVALMAVFVVLVGAYVGVRIWRYARGHAGERPESE